MPLYYHPITARCLAIANLKGYVHPTYLEALAFHDTEVAEANEIYFAGDGRGWVRNHPENKPPYDKDRLGEELADAIVMLIRAGISQGVDPLWILDERSSDQLVELEGKSEDDY